MVTLVYVESLRLIWMLVIILSCGRRVQGSLPLHQQHLVSSQVLRDSLSWHGRAWIIITVHYKLARVVVVVDCCLIITFATAPTLCSCISTVNGHIICAVLTRANSANISAKWSHPRGTRGCVEKSSQVLFDMARWDAQIGRRGRDLIWQILLRPIHLPTKM